MCDMIPETVLFLVHNGGEYSAYSVEGLFTDKKLAEEFAAAANGVVEEWPANVPKTKWMTWSANLQANKTAGRWEFKLTTHRFNPSICKQELKCELGHFAGWGKPDEHGHYTYGYAQAIGQSEEQVRKMCSDAFWAEVAKLDL